MGENKGITPEDGNKRNDLMYGDIGNNEGIASETAKQEIENKKEADSGNIWDLNNQNGKTPAEQSLSDLETKREKELRDRKKRMVVTSIGDAISSFANLYFTTKGAPSITNATAGTGYRKGIVEGGCTGFGLTGTLKERYRNSDKEYQRERERLEKLAEKQRRAAEKEAKRRSEEIESKKTYTIGNGYEFEIPLSQWKDDNFNDVIYNDLRDEIYEIAKKKGKYSLEDTTFPEDGYILFPENSKIYDIINNIPSKGRRKYYIQQILDTLFDKDFEDEDWDEETRLRLIEKYKEMSERYKEGGN